MEFQDSDYNLAKRLQEEFDEENRHFPKTEQIQTKNKPNTLVDPDFEHIDPNPDIFSLFQIFDSRFFWNKLGCVEIKWSSRMYSCAGTCTYKGKCGGCVIGLSLPLLKLRPRKDLVETLLHEMIHAFLFVTNNNRDRGGHGPEFKKHMNRINTAAGTNITVYHDFHDEVKHYKTHWWRCDGPCRNSHPFYGTVKRASNRAPGPNDFWYAVHQRTCGGTFIKIKEPEDFKSKKKAEKKIKIDSKQIKITSLFNSVKNISKTSSEHNDSTNQINQKTDTTSVNTTNTFEKSTNIIGLNATYNTPTKLNNNLFGQSITKKNISGNLNNVVGFKNFTNSSTASHEASKFVPFSGSGYALNSDCVIKKTDNKMEVDISKSKKRKHDEIKDKSVKSSDDANYSKSEIQSTLNNKTVPCPICEENVKENIINEHIDMCLPSNSGRVNNGDFLFDSDSDTDIINTSRSNCPVCNKEFETDVLQSHLETCLTDVFNNSEIADFEETVSTVDGVLCPCCSKEFTPETINNHLDSCLSSSP